jgi:hypothetical protein
VSTTYRLSSSWALRLELLAVGGTPGVGRDVATGDEYLLGRDVLGLAG